MPAYLLDTQIVIWASMEPEKLSPAIALLIADPDETMFVSSVSIAEMSIKQSIGKLSLATPAVELCAQMDFSELALSWAAAEHIGRLPLIHRDPFDRLLIGQAIEHNLVLITSDSAILQYPEVSLLSNHQAPTPTNH
jgi:PIN domain nuclease of toxin-antitoxin system